MIKQFGLTILIIAILIINVDAQLTEKSLIEHQNEIQLWLKEYNVPAIGIGIIIDGKLSVCEVLGNNRKNISANNNTIFTIASVTKTIATAVTLKLIESGTWN